MHFFLMLAIFLYLGALCFALVVNEADVDMAKKNRENPVAREDVWLWSCIGFALMVFVPVVTLTLSEEFRSRELIFSLEAWTVWLSFNLVAFVAVRRFAYRPLMRNLDARRAER